MSKKKIHLIANAHIDPVWLWRKDEGAAAALATFRSAANLLEKNDFIFCHNEMLLYSWIEEYDPELFKRIQKFVKEGKWHITGGWYLQPDCNMPSGESIVRQAKTGQNYFKRKFGVNFKTALSLDAFGHSIGLVQILKKCGYENYLITRPHHFENQPVPKAGFKWRGLDGSEVKVMLVDVGYSSKGGAIGEKIKMFVSLEEKNPNGCLLWGVGNHGGGPSQEDIDYLAKNPETDDYVFVHSTPDSFFEELHPTELFEKGLNRTMTGCYTSLIRIKQLHRKLENLIWSTEKLSSFAALSGLIEYPDKEIERAQQDLMFCQFHDILPGSCVREGEDEAIETLHRGIDTVKRVRTRAFFALADTAAKSEKGEYPVIVCNPHPYEVRMVIEAECVMENQNWGEGFMMPEVSINGKVINSQLIRERSSLNLDWVKRFAFEAILKPMSVTRYSVYMKESAARPEINQPDGELIIKNNCGVEVKFDRKTGCILEMRVNDVKYLSEGAFKIRVYEDNADPWAMGEWQRDKLVTKAVGEFSCADDKTLCDAINCNVAPASVRVVEDGELFTDVEVLTVFGNSRCETTYRIYKNYSYIDVSLRLLNAEADKLFKLEIPVAFRGKYVGQIMFGKEELSGNGFENVSQKWIAVTNENKTLGVINDGVYGSSENNGTLSISLLRSGVYAAHPINGRKLYSEKRIPDRYDKGERFYKFRVGAFLEDELDREAQLFAEQPFAMNYFPSGKGEPPVSALKIEDSRLILTCFKRSIDNDESYIVRIQNGSEKQRATKLYLFEKLLGNVDFAPFEVVTLRISNGQMRRLEQMEI